MNARLLILFLFLLSSPPLRAQGTFVYDQESVDTDTRRGESPIYIQQNQPLGQSFTPTLSSVGFIRLYLFDGTLTGNGATLYVALRSDSITGPVLSSTEPVFLPNGSGGLFDFYFTTPVAVTPGVAYYFQPIVQSGDLWNIVADTQYNYTGGIAFGQGQPAPDYDLWFREGIIIPEPSAASLLLLGCGMSLYVRHLRSKRR